MKIRLAILTAAALPAVALSTLNVDPYSTSVTPGVWCGNYQAAKSYAETNAIPLVLVWGNEGCTHCAALTSALSTAEALQWAGGQNAVFCFVEGQKHYDVSPNYGAKEFAQAAGGLSPSSPTDYPFVCFYMAGDKANTYGGIEQFAVFKSSYELFRSSLKKTGAYFPFGDTENDRLEAVIGETEWVDVPVVRSGDLSAASASVKFTCGDDSSVVALAWADGETGKTVRYKLPTEFETAKYATATLVAPDDSVLDERTITGIVEAENSTKNPKWIGEKIDYGEWTMDIDAVTNLVAESGGHALVLFAGGCWCPDCAMADERLFDRGEFREWAKSNRVALGLIDIPNNPSSTTNYPSLLTYTSYRTSDSYVTLRNSSPTNELMRYQSGAGYLSRHSIEPQDALSVIERNKRLAMNTVPKGGWNSADRDGKARPGVPSLVALRPDGTICGRWTPFNEVGPSAYSEGFLRRFEEMFAQSAEADEEANDHWTTTRQSITADGSVSATLSAADAKDVYRIDAELYTVATFTFESDVKTPFILSVTDYSGETPRTLAESTGGSEGPVCVTARVSSAACYAGVSFPTTKGIANHPALAATNLSSTVAGYVLSSTGVMSGGDIRFEETAMSVQEGNGEQHVKIRVVRANGYRGSVVAKVKRVDAAADPRAEWSDATLAWADGESDVREVDLTLNGDTSATYDLSLLFALEIVSAESEDTSVPSESSRMTVRVRDDDLEGTLAYRNVAYAETVQIPGWTAGDTVRLRKMSGSLPAGLAVAVVDGTVRVSGVPKVVGVRSAAYTISLLRDGAWIPAGTVDLSYTVKAIDFSNVIPSVTTVRNYRNIPVIEDGRMAATLTLSVPASGRLSAKCRTADGACVRYSAESWSEFNEAESRLSAVLSASDGSGAVEVALSSGSVSATIRDEAGSVVAEVGPFSSEPWSAANPADAWAGQYNVQLPQTNAVDGASAGRLSGAAYMAMRLVSESAKKNGTMLYAGVLPNGRAVSGYSTLWKSGSSALVAFCCADGDSVSPYAFSGAFSVTPPALSSSRWLVESACAAEWSSADVYGHTGVFAVYGGYYDADEIKRAFELDFENDAARFAFAADTACVVSGRYGEAIATAPVAAEMGDDGPSISQTAENPQFVSLSFSPATGVVHGTLRLPFADEYVAVVYRGISLPGWQSCEECTMLPERPWALGACSFADRDGQGPFRNGCAVGLGRYMEQ